MTTRVSFYILAGFIIGIFFGAWFLRNDIKYNPDWIKHDTIPKYVVVCDSSKIPQAFLNKLP
jgi:hypothetical protein